MRAAALQLEVVSDGMEIDKGGRFSSRTEINKPKFQEERT